MITQQSTPNQICDNNEWLQSSMTRNHKKIQNITINNGSGEKTPLCWDKNNDDV